jgi:hypothetical protein
MRSQNSILEFCSGSVSEAISLRWPIFFRFRTYCVQRVYQVAFLYLLFCGLLLLGLLVTGTDSGKVGNNLLCVFSLSGTRLTAVYQMGKSLSIFVTGRYVWRLCHDGVAGAVLFAGPRPTPVVLSGRYKDSRSIDREAKILIYLLLFFS